MPIILCYKWTFMLWIEEIKTWCVMQCHVREKFSTSVGSKAFSQIIKDKHKLSQCLNSISLHVQNQMQAVTFLLNIQIFIILLENAL